MGINLRWLRRVDLEELERFEVDEGWIVDRFELEKILERFPYLCYGAYDGNIFVGAVIGYLHQRSGWISNFIVKPSYRNRGIGSRLFKTLFRAMKFERESIYLNSTESMERFYEKFGFKRTIEVGRFSLKQMPKFKFNPSHMRYLERIDFDSIAKKIDSRIFREDRGAFLFEDMPHKNSLKLATENGFAHSKVVGVDSVVFLGPFEVKSGAYLDAEKLIRATLYFRGFKKVYADIPTKESDITSLFQNYNFEQVSKNYQMVYGEAESIKYSEIYSFASAGVCG